MIKQLIFAAALGSSVVALAQPAPEIRQDHHEVQSDQQAVLQDRRDVHRDVQTGDRRDAHADETRLRGDTHAYGAARHDLNGDVSATHRGRYFNHGHYYATRYRHHGQWMYR